MGLIRAYHNFIRSDEVSAAGISAGATMTALLTGGIAFQAARSGDILGAFEAGATAVALGGLAFDTAIVSDRAVAAAQAQPPQV